MKIVVYLLTSLTVNAIYNVSFLYIVYKSSFNARLFDQTISEACMNCELIFRVNDMVNDITWDMFLCPINYFECWMSCLSVKCKPQSYQ